MAIAKPATNPAPEPVTTYAVTVQWMPAEQHEDGSRSGACYVALDNDVPGLILEADSLDEMEKHMREMVPMMLEMNCGIDDERIRHLNITMLGKADPRGVTKYEITHP